MSVLLGADGDVDNDATLRAYTRRAVVQAETGAASWPLVEARDPRETVLDPTDGTPARCVGVGLLPVCEAQGGNGFHVRQQRRADLTVKIERGGGFTAGLTVQVRHRHGLKRSMGDTGIYWDNSPAESFWPTCNTNRTTDTSTPPKPNSLPPVDNWNRRYNHDRRHSVLGMLSPIRYEQSLTDAAKAAWNPLHHSG
ncbi:transposase [Streptomyces gardneri]|uniref:integrase core domain-containing protein n=1 Tax=Nocardia TaxID=1817 RepID=UPI001357AA91|nr:MULTISPECIES: integrase core domain-containing protein [Nocardia]MBF6167876.1 transposase [Streptomyces gardneri]MBF6206259.1 transposase [Streptomyces gardneri]